MAVVVVASSVVQHTYIPTPTPFPIDVLTHWLRYVVPCGCYRTLSVEPGESPNSRAQTPDPSDGTVETVRRKSGGIDSPMRRREASICLDESDETVTKNVEALKGLFNRHLHFTLAQDLMVASHRDFYVSLAYVFFFSFFFFVECCTTHRSC